MLSQRQDKIKRILAEEGLDGMVLNAGPSLHYFSGLNFHLMERPVLLFLVSGKNPLIVMPELERAKLERVGFDIDSFTYPDDPARWPSVFGEAGARLELDGLRIGYEPRQLRMLEYTYLQATTQTTLIAADRAVARCRAIKDEGEIELMKEAVRIAQQSLTQTLPLIKAGMSEQEVAAELIIRLFRNGSEQPLPFSPIVSTGAGAANPHGRPSSNRLCRGDLLVIDWGASWQGYVSDLTRTFAIGKADEQSRRIHALVQQANKTGRRAAGPGRTCRSVDQAARSVIDAAGFGDNFTHRTGHGIGMECHEEPYIHGGNRHILEPGMTFTVEPGIYLKKMGGVRIEDDVLITRDGSLSLSDLPRELIILDE